LVSRTIYFFCIKHPIALSNFAHSARFANPNSLM
jgi:hypothetical protein